MSNFNNRAYWAIKNQSWGSDVLAPTVISNINSIITHGDTTPITGYAGLPVQTTSGGVASALLVFKAFQIWQVTGDAAQPLNPLANNFLSLTLGSQSPRSIVETPLGTIFIAIDGPYRVDQLGIVHPLKHDDQTPDQDVQVPFQNTTAPTRTAGGFTGNIYRSSVYTAINGIPLKADYWFDSNRRRWTGPHTVTFDILAPVANYFIVSDENYGAALFKSPILPDTLSVYNDNGVALTVLCESSTFPKDMHMAQRQVVESTIEVSSGGNQVVYTINAIDDQGAILNTATVTTPAAGFLWGSNLWGVNNWASANSIPHVYQIPWTAPVVFQKMATRVTASASSGLSIGTQFHRYEDAGYLVGS